MKRGLSLFAVVLVGGCAASSGSTQEAGVYLDKHEVLRPGMTELPLRAGGVEECAEPDRRVRDVQVEETATEVVVSASIQVDSPGATCEIRNVSEPFIARLKEPLGARSVISEFDGVRRTISTAARRRDIAVAALISVEAAERFLRQTYPSAKEIHCNRQLPERFQCMVTRQDDPGRDFPGVFVRDGRRLELDPGPTTP